MPCEEPCCSGICAGKWHFLLTAGLNLLCWKIFGRGIIIGTCRTIVQLSARQNSLLLFPESGVRLATFGKNARPRELMKYQVFQDFDAFASSVRDVDHVMLLQNLKRPAWSIRQVNLAGVHLQLGSEGSGNITEGRSRSDGYVLFMPLKHVGAHRANGTALDENSFAILEPGCDLCVRCPIEHDWCSVFVPTRMLARDCDLVKLSSTSEKTTVRVIRANPQTANQFRSLVGQIMIAAATCSDFESTPAATCAAAELLKIASFVVSRQQAIEPSRQGRPRVPRQEIIRCSTELLEQRVGAPVRVDELAAAADVSQRTLRTAFEEYFGLGPVRYLQLRQLHQVFRALTAADPEEITVSRTFAEHGAWAFGRFSARYRQLFGELPSETLRRTRPR